MIAIAICLASTTTVFAQEETGVEINGIIWATRNVGAPNTFVDKPEDYGNYYTWEEAMNVCPTNWRLPYSEELRNLRDVGSVWETINDANGRVFSSGDNTVFLPAAGYYPYEEYYINSNLLGSYWSNTPIFYPDESYTMAFAFSFTERNARSGLSDPDERLSVRCVKDDAVGINDISDDTETTVVTGYFDIFGRKLKEEPQQGFYIILYDNGKTRKVMK